MSNVKHTPGPWFVASDAARESVVPILDWSGRSIGHTPHTREGIANALLMASAPGLLAALEGIIGLNGQRIDGDLMSVARAAIRKARGES